MDFDGSFVASFQALGFVKGIDVHSAASAADVCSAWNELEAAEGLRDQGYSTAHSRHLDQRFVWELAVNSTILDSVESLIGPDILLFGTRFFCKYGPYGGHRVSWHQDLDSWGLVPPTALTVWYAIDDSDEWNGCMQVIPGSHRSGLRNHLTSSDEGSMLGRGQHLELSPAESANAVPVVLKAGQISIHDGGLLHASMANRSTRRRCGLAIRYVPSHVRQDATLAHSPLAKAILVRGEDRARNFGANPVPVF